MHIVNETSLQPKALQLMKKSLSITSWLSKRRCNAYNILQNILSLFP